MESELTETRKIRIRLTEDGEPIPEILERLARRVVAFFTERTNSEQPLDRFSTLAGLADELGCDVEFADAEPETSYCPVRVGEFRGVITLDGSEPIRALTRRLGHELTHHVLYWQLIAIYEHEIEELVHVGDLDIAEEKICRAVEDLILALPSGMQWNGRLALPRGDGTVRTYRQIRIPKSLDIPAEEWEQWLTEAENELPAEPPKV